MGLDEDATAILVVAGSWGVGDVAPTARALRDAGVGTPVVLCGRNEDLRAELAAEDGVVALGWTTEVRRLMAASDVLVHNAGGLSCLEGFAIGLPVIGHACLPGHGHRNAEAMRDAGVAAYAESTEDLVAEVRRLARTPEGAALAGRARDLFRDDPTDVLLDLAAAPVPAPRVTAHPAATWARRTAAVATAVPLVTGALSFGVAEATVHAKVGVAEGHGQVYVAAVLDHVQVQDPRVVRALRASGVTAAVPASSTGPTPTDVRLLSRAGVTVVGADLGRRTRNPDRLQDELRAAASAVAAVPDPLPKVVCLRNPGMVERVVAWDHDVQLALPDEVVLPHEAPRRLKAGRQLVLDERGRTAAQVVSDLAALQAQVRTAGLPLAPLRALWP